MSSRQNRSTQRSPAPSSPETYEELGPLIVDEIKAHAEGSPYEVCGIVWSDGTVMPLRNEAMLPEEEFFVGKFQLSQVEFLANTFGKHVVATYHSHPSGSAVPSAADIATLRRLAEVADESPVSIIWGKKDGLRGWTWDDGLEEVVLGV